MSAIVVNQILFLVILIGLGIPLGVYSYRVMSGKKVFLSRVIEPIENQVYKFIGKPAKLEMTAKKYALAIVSFSLFELFSCFSIDARSRLFTCQPNGFFRNKYWISF
ncbi:potassium-transporting ATPase subunit KdpA [Carnobacterium maltaromaticum]